MPDEQVAVLEQVADLLLDPLLAPGGTTRRLRARTAAWQLGSTGRQILAQFGHGREDRLGHFFENMERAKLMRHIAEDRGDRFGVQRRAVGCDPLEAQPARVQGGMEAAEERFNVAVGGIVVEDLVGEPLEGAVIDDREDAERSVIELVRCDEAREIRQRPVEVVGVDSSRRLFPPRPRPSSGSWRTGRTHGARARGSNWRYGTVNRPQ